MHLLETRFKETELATFVDGGRNYFAEVWNKIAFAIGIRSSLSEQELQIIAEFLRDEFKTLTLKDISRAFNLYAAQKLEFKNSHFQSLDNVFIGNVLESYKEFTRKANLKPKGYIPVEKQIENKLDPKHEQEKAFKFIEKVYLESGKFPNIANWSEAFIYAEEKGIINLSIEEKEKIKQLIILQDKQEKFQRRQETGIKNIVSKLKPFELKVRCREQAIINHFKKL